MPVKSLFGAGVMGVAVIAGSAAADVVDLGASRDNTLFSTVDGAISNGMGEHMYVGRNAFGNTRRGLVRFDLAAIPPGSTITSVRVTLYMSQSIAMGVNVTLYRALKDWGEGGSNSGDPGGQGAPSMPGDATWLHTFYPSQFWSGPGGTPAGPTPDYVSGASATVVVGNSIQAYSWDSTPALVADAQGWLANPASNFGWFIIGDESATGTAKRFETHESVFETNRPVLNVVFTPPAACYANCDHSTMPPVLTISDFGCFLNAFAAGASYANCDGSTVQPVLTVADFGCFLNAFAAGCS